MSQYYSIRSFDDRNKSSHWLPTHNGSGNPAIQSKPRKTVSSQQPLPGLASMIMSQSKNMRELKARILSDKCRVDEDVAVLRCQICNELDDLRLSVHAVLDRIYREYLEIYQKFKSEVQEVGILPNIVDMSVGSPCKSGTSISIANCLQANSFSKIQRERMSRLLEQFQALTRIHQYEMGFYQSREFVTAMNTMWSHVHQKSQQIHNNWGMCIRELSVVAAANETEILSALDGKSNLRSDLSHRGNAIPAGQISASLQSVQFKSVQNVTLKEVMKLPMPGQQPLCGLSICNQLVIGCEDGSLVVSSHEGLPIAVLRKHEASICSLAVIKFRGQEYLASGSDHGCNRIFIWETTNWTVIHQFQHHTAAVVSLVDLKDDCHFLSTGYDRRTNIYSVDKVKLVYSLPLNKTPVIGAVINHSGARVITCSLEKVLKVWQVFRQAGKVKSMQLEKTVAIDSLVCSIQASVLVNDLIVLGLKNGTVCLMDVEKGQIYKTVKSCENYITELVLVERQHKKNNPIAIAWSYLETAISIVNSETSSIRTHAWTGSLQFCCGVGPKAFLADAGKHMFCISQHQNAQEITMIQLKKTS